jgi:hypothetical protein
MYIKTGRRSGRSVATNPDARGAKLKLRRCIGSSPGITA